MERIIKFRVWDGAKMIDLANNDSRNYLSIGLTWEARDFKDKCICSSRNKDARLMQFTGLQDKNGVGIYEGDILVSPNYPTEKYECKFSVMYGTARFHLECIGKNWDFGGKTSEYLEIIGNIMENPELIK